MSTCTWCDGLGKVDGDCGNCQGYGYFEEEVEGDGEITCESCDGEGDFVEECWDCNGTGELEDNDG